MYWAEWIFVILKLYVYVLFCWSKFWILVWRPNCSYIIQLHDVSNFEINLGVWYIKTHCLLVPGGCYNLLGYLSIGIILYIISYYILVNLALRKHTTYCTFLCCVAAQPLSPTFPYGRIPTVTMIYLWCGYFSSIFLAGLWWASGSLRRPANERWQPRRLLPCPLVHAALWWTCWAPLLLQQHTNAVCSSSVCSIALL